MAATGHPRLSKLVRLYVIDNQGKATYITVDIDGVSTADEYIYQWQYKLNLPYGETIAMITGRAMVPTRLGSDKAWHKRTVDDDGDFMPSVRATMQAAVKYTPDNSAYGLVFLNTGAWNGAQFEAATAIVHDRSKEASADPALVTPVETPLERWYNAHKEFKAAEETLLKRLKEALVEKSQGYTEFKDNTEALLAFMLKSTKNTVFLGHPARFDAYEACGLRFGPVLGCPELYLSSLSSVYASGDIVHQVRMSDFPWVSKEQD